ncbi:MAG: gliding motility-associated C-terminal domain-containing protein [Saprospiraceae bacterium]|nr:gliding motility-associated C-terminal domain-containing protein [Saprospiraceae bacterium]
MQATWQSPRGVVLEQPVLFDLQASDFGTYLLKAKDTFGCVVEQSFDVTGSKPPEVQVTLEPICDTVKVSLSPDSLFYQWEAGVIGSTFATTRAGNYSVEAKSSTGCKSTFIVEVPSADTIGFEVVIQHPTCPNDPTGSLEIITNTPDLPMIFSIDGGNEYHLSPRFEQLFGGDYQVVVQDELGCIKTKSVKIETPDTLAIQILTDSALIVRPNTSIQLNTTQLGQVKTFQWLPDDIHQDMPNISFLATENMDIRVVVEDERGCLASDGVSLTIALGEIYVPNIFSPDFDGVNDFFTFFSDDTSGEMIAELRIFDRWGMLVFETKEIPLNKSNFGWDGSYLNKPLENGIFTYHAMVRFGNNTIKSFKGEVTLTRKK